MHMDKHQAWQKKKEEVSEVRSANWRDVYRSWEYTDYQRTFPFGLLQLIQDIYGVGFDEIFGMKLSLVVSLGIFTP